MLDHLVSRADSKTIPVTPILRSDYKAWVKRQSKATQRWLAVTEFAPDGARVALLPGRDGSLREVLLGLGDRGDVWCYAALPGRLPKGRYRIDGQLDSSAAHDAALGWALASYRFDRYKKQRKIKAKLVWPAGCDRDSVRRTAEAIGLGRDLITTPAGDMGPAELADAAKGLAKRYGAKCKLTVGQALLKSGYPAIHAVGKGSPRDPRLIDLSWGSPKAKKVSLVGKGVCFDTGGLDLKSAAGMKLMKKDMGGAASVLALASMVMDAGLNVRLRVLVPAVENAVSGEAYHPMDVLDTRKGLTVEVGNTDAEGRLVLADALAEADSEKPDLLIDFATLTGAARVALGTELPAAFCNDDAIAAALIEAGDAALDPLWRMPLFPAYRRHMDSRVADLNNIASVAYGGAITAALFLKEFVSARTRWVHIDTMGWNASSRAGRPEGGEVFGVRACFHMLAERYGIG